jgi:hypothetical protein
VADGGGEGVELRRKLEIDVGPVVVRAGEAGEAMVDRLAVGVGKEFEDVGAGRAEGHVG